MPVTGERIPNLMSKKMLINALHPEEARVAIVEDGLLVDLDIEITGSEQTRGNVYKGVVVRVEPGLQAAFVDIGLKKLGFLQMGELHPDYWQWRDDVPEEQRKRRPRIQEVLRRGQELIVQVEKGERDMKGAALTSYLSLPGRYMVLMPGSDSNGVSRKVESESERKKLKAMVAAMEIPEGIGTIIRTEALGKTQEELDKDLHYLLNLYATIKEKAAETKGAALVYQESGLVIRTIRDYFTAEIDEVLVDSKDVYRQTKEFFHDTLPVYEHVVKPHKEKRPIFSKYQLEEQIDLIYEKKVPLKSGGSLVIEPTEALVSIDVNSGKSTGERGVEDTAFKTNMEAAEEVARQLRLRDLGGLIVIDFIDMRDRKHNADVEKTLKAALKSDKARVTVGKISQFGMLEMSRQRIRQTVSQAVYYECPHCEGRGRIKTVEAMGMAFLRKVHAAAAKGTVAEVRGGLPLEVAYFLLNRKKRELAQIETEYDIEVTVKGKPSFLMNQLELEVTKREKPLSIEPVEEQKAAAPVTAEPSAELPVEAGEEGKGKKKRRRGKKKKGEGEGAHPELPTEEVAATGEPLEAPEQMEAGEATGDGEAVEEEHHAGEHKKKRRRRRRRGKGGAGAEAGEHADAEAAGSVTEPQEAIEVTEHAEEAGEEHAEGTDEAKKKRRRRRKRGGKGAGMPAEGDVAAAVETPVIAEEPASAAPEATEPPAAEEKPKKPRAPRKKTVDAVEAAEPVAEPAPVPDEPAPAEPPAETPKKPRAPRARKTAEPKAAEPAVEPAPISESAPAEPAEKPKKPRAPRTKKAVTTEPVPAEPAEQPKKPRAPRKKKEPAAE